MSFSKSNYFIIKFIYLNTYFFIIVLYVSASHKNTQLSVACCSSFLTFQCLNVLILVLETFIYRYLDNLSICVYHSLHCWSSLFETTFWSVLPIWHSFTVLKHVVFFPVPQLLRTALALLVYLSLWKLWYSGGIYQPLFHRNLFTLYKNIILQMWDKFSTGSWILAVEMSCRKVVAHILKVVNDLYTCSRRVVSKFLCLSLV